MTQGVCCHDCDAPYGQDGWCDVVVPDDIWNAICPEGGVLCFRCMTKRIAAKGLDNVPVIVASGPYADANERWRMIGWRHGHSVALKALLPAAKAAFDALDEHDYCGCEHPACKRCRADADVKRARADIAAAITDVEEADAAAVQPEPFFRLRAVVYWDAEYSNWVARSLESGSVATDTHSADEAESALIQLLRHEVSVAVRDDTARSLFHCPSKFDNWRRYLESSIEPKIVRATGQHGNKTAEFELSVKVIPREAACQS